MDYGTGYAMAALPADFEKCGWLKKSAMLCERFILGIPSNAIYERIFGSLSGYDAESQKEYWLNFRWISEVVVLSDDMLSYQRMHGLCRFDVCFYGSEYGTRFEDDRRFMESNGVGFVSLVPPGFSCEGETNAATVFLKSAYIRKKIVVFGCGAYFERFMEQFERRFVPNYIVDNDSRTWGTYRHGVAVKNPAELEKENPKNILIVVCSKDSSQIVEQIHGIADFDYRTVSFRNGIAVLESYFDYKTDQELNELTLKKIHDINYALLKEFDALCGRHNIEYFANYGTLLGAVRHKGFIPWDNDIDVIMKRDEHLKLAEHKDELPDAYYWLPDDLIGDKKYYDTVPRLAYKNAYIRKVDDSAEFYGNYYNSIHLDMFAVDKTYDNVWGKLQRYELALLYGLMNAYRHKSMFFDYDKKMQFYNTILCGIGRHIPLRWLKNRADKVARRFNKDDKAPYYFISNCALCKLWLLFPKEIFEKPPVRLPFGELTVSASAEYADMCRRIFGNYMALPPKAHRVPHCNRKLLTCDLFVFNAPEKRGER